MSAVAQGAEAAAWRFVRPFARLTLDDVGLVGGENAAVGEILHAPVSRGERVPDGRALTADRPRW